MARKKLTPPGTRRRRARNRPTSLGWWGTVSLVVLLGVVAVVVSRETGSGGDIVRELTMPDIGGATRISVERVLVEPYDRVDEGDPIYEVSAGRTEREVNAPTTGIVVELLAQEGEEVAPGTRLGTVQTGPDFNQGNAAGHHWHTAYGVNVCGNWLPQIGEFQSDYHTHGDGIIHAHGRSSSAAGTNATLGLFFERAGLKLDIDEVQYSDGETYQSGDVDCDGDTGVLRWALNGEEQRGNPADFVVGNGDVVVLAFLPEDAELQTVPPSMAFLAENYAPPKHPDFQPPEEPAPGDAHGDEESGEGAEEGDGESDGSDDTSTTSPTTTTTVPEAEERGGGSDGS